MARIPNVYAPIPTEASLGVASQRPTDENAEVGFSDAGKNLNDLGDTLESAGAQINKNQNELAASTATAQVLTTHAQAINDLQTNPYDPDAIDNYKQTMQQAVQDAASNITNSDVRAQFLANEQLRAAQNLSTVYEINRSKYNDAQTAQMNQNLDSLQKTYLSSSDPATRTQALNTANQIIQTNAQAGTISQVDAQKTGKNWMQSTAKTFVNSLPPDQQYKTLSAIAQPTGSDSNSVINFVMDHNEGGYTPDDNGHGPTNFGINSQANAPTLAAMGITDVKNMSKSQAAQIYKANYWDAIGADNLPDNMKAIAFDTAVNFGVPRAQQMLAQAGNDPVALNQLRQQAHSDIAANNPQDAASLPAWQARDQRMASISQGQSPMTGTIADFYPRDEVPTQLARAKSAWDDQRLQQGTQQLFAATPAQVGGILNQYQDDPGIQLALQGAYGKIADARAADPMAWAVHAGQTQTPTIDFTNPANLSQQISSRVQDAQKISSAYNVPMTPLTSDEAANFKAYADTQPPQQNLALLKAIRMGAPDDTAYQSIMTQISPHDPVLASAGAMVADNNPPANGSDPAGIVAQRLLLGRALISPEGKNGLPAGRNQIKLPDDLEKQFGAVAGSLYPNMPHAFNDDFQAVRADYAALVNDKSNYTGELDDAALKKAVTDVVGGIANVGGKATMVPFGMDPSDFANKMQPILRTALAQQTAHPEYVNNAWISPRGVPGEYYVMSGTDHILNNKTGQPVTVTMPKYGPFPQQGNQFLDFLQSVEQPANLNTGVSNAP